MIKLVRHLCCALSSLGAAQWTLCVEDLLKCVVQCLCSQFSSLELEGASRRYSPYFTEYLAHIPYSEVFLCYRMAWSQ